MVNAVNASPNRRRIDDLAAAARFGSGVVVAGDDAPGRAPEADGLTAVAAEVRACRICRDTPAGAPLPHEPRPVFRASLTATLVIAGQAPGTRVHASGLPFTDPSGDRLRSWLGLDQETFYDVRRVALVPMGFCFPGQDRKGGDLPPRRECGTHWHARLFATMPRVRLIVAIGAHAQAWHLGASLRPGLTATVAAWREILTETVARGGPAVLALPHPSWRNNGWLRLNPWFEAELLPVLRAMVADEVRAAPA